MNFLTVYQIYFSDEQLEKLDYIPYHNKDTTPFFESKVMVDLINQGAHKNSQYFAVLSYKLREKIRHTRTNWKNLPNIANHSIRTFDPALFEYELKKQQPDVMSFQRHQPHDPITFANQFHPNFSHYTKTILSKIGFDWQPTHLNNVFYCNYFTAKSELYERFVKEMLEPAINVMVDMPELWNNSHYPQPLPETLKEKWNINHYPYHAFICERFFSYWVHLNNLNCLHF